MNSAQCSLQIPNTLSIAAGPASIRIDETVLESDPAMPAHRGCGDQRCRLECAKSANPPIEAFRAAVVPNLRNEWREFSGIAFLSHGISAKRENDGMPMTGDDPTLHKIEQMVEFICSIDDVLNGNALLVGPSIQVRSSAFRARVRDQLLGRDADCLGANGSYHGDLLVGAEDADRFSCNLDDELRTSELPHRFGRGQIARHIKRMTTIRIANVHMNGLRARTLACKRIRCDCLSCQRQIWMLGMAFARAIRRDHNSQIGHASPTLQ